MNEPARFQSPEYLAVLSPETSDMHCTCTADNIGSMRLAAEQAYPHEACGLLIGRLGTEGWRVQGIRPVANLNTERAADRFQLDPEAYRRIDHELRGSEQEIIGVFHSHPDCPAKPSPTDLENAWEGFVYPIVSVHQGRAIDVRCWTLGSDARFWPVTFLQEIS
jgi:proteasome lid subunit RPN8/RPN11